MKNKLAVRRIFIIGIGLLIVLTLNGCFSYFPRNEPLNNSVSKLKLKDGSEVIFNDDSKKLNEINTETVVYQNLNGESYSIPINQVERWYVYRFNLQKTIFTLLFGAMGLIFLIALLMPSFRIG